MLGMIFTELVEMVEERFSPALADDILAEAGLDHGGAYTAVGYYPFEELQTLVGLLAARTGIAVPDLIEAFGQYLFLSFTRSHSTLLAGKTTLLDLLETLDGDIHKEVYKLYPEARLPEFRVISRTEQQIELEYRSPHNLQPLALGLIKGGGAWFGHPQLTVESVPLQGSTLFRVQI
ncbi:heme NO-binding domain-containing protein [Oceanobacter mangrovi]|uniref:heme NO-binding domain-containing protein n=1 Tax=Oceanobacter mangrovi TaxID=2862510 RepID=UPI001C8D9B93|nr:heme NO-binding domain-containing protein [Oceanobacter mangrovi]